MKELFLGLGERGEGGGEEGGEEEEGGGGRE